MLNHTNSLIVSEECYNSLLDYENLTTSEFTKYVDTILNIHKLEFGLNSFTINYQLKYFKITDKNKEEIVVKMAEAIAFLKKKALV